MITFPRSERSAILKRPEFHTETLASCPTMRTVGTKEAELTLRPQELRAVALIAITTALTTERRGRAPEPFAAEAIASSLALNCLPERSAIRLPANTLAAPHSSHVGHSFGDGDREGD